MESLTIELFSNASALLFPDNTLSSFTKFLPEQLNLGDHWVVAEISYPSMCQNVKAGKFMFFDKKFSKSTEFYFLEPALHPSITNIVETINTLIQERDNHSEICITVKVSRRTQNLKLTLQRKDLVLHSSLRMWDTCSELMSVSSLE